MTDLQDLRRRVDRKLADYRAAKAEFQREQEALSVCQQRQEALRQAQALAQQVAQEVQQQAHHQIADIVSRALEAVFDEPYLFKINFVQKRGRTEAELVFERNGLQVDPMTAAGGGVIDVAAFALRLSCLLLSRPPVRRFLAMDEPWKFLSVEYRPRMRGLVESLSKELGVQFLIVTHDNEFKIGKVVEL